MMRHAREMLTAVVVISLAAGACWAGDPTAEIKWSQPVVRDSNDPTFIVGWDEPSMDPPLPIAADDFLCNDPRPVTDVHWWGSFPLIQAGAPVRQPDGFTITFWTDVAAGQDANPDVTWSHPGQPIHAVDVRQYISEHAGWDVELDTYFSSGGTALISVDEAFQYNATFDNADFFDQVQGTVYWISIQAYYDRAEDANLWGWKTREHFWNDDAVAGIIDPTGGQNFLWAPLIGLDLESWDLAFELSVPEPTTMVLLSVAGVGLLVRRRRRQR